LLLDDLIEDQIDVGAVRWPQIWSNKRALPAYIDVCLVSKALSTFRPIFFKNVCYFKEYITEIEDEMR